MKIVISQTNPTPCDFDGNVAQIITAVKKGIDEKADLVIAPELSIPGYLCRDAVYNEGFIEENLKGLQKIVNASAGNPSLTIVVGYVERNRTGIGKPFFNSAAVVRNGMVIANYRKQLLPFYDVFDEGRYYEAGNDLTTIDIDGTMWGIIICEDGWMDKMTDAYRYEENPVARYRNIGVRNLISLNSSPYVIGKPVTRNRMLNQITSGGGTLIYVNQVGGMDDLVFDGNSIVSAGGITRYACGSNEDNFLIDLDVNCGFQSVSDDINVIRKHLITGLHDYIVKSGFADVVVASSGGIDSALVLCMACEAIGPKHVHAIRMPSVYSSKGSIDDALALHTFLGCQDYLVPIDHMKMLKETNNALGSKELANKFCRYNKVADENIQARLRAINLMHFSNSFGALALTTGNKSENATGYCTLGGDMMGGFAPIQDLYKTQVYEFAKLYGMPESIIKKAPSAELAPNQLDEETLLPYNILDLIIYAYVELHISTLASFLSTPHKHFSPTFSDEHVCQSLPEFSASNDAEASYKRIIRLIDLNEFKRRQVAPGIKISKVAFGTGRRFPIVRKRT